MNFFRVIDNGRCSSFFSFDYSKTFNTINHYNLFNILKSWGFREDSVSLIKSYLQEQKVSNQVTQYHLLLRYGLGFTKGKFYDSYCSFQFTNLIRRSTIHIFADDSLLYDSFYIDDLSNPVSNINEDLERVANMFATIRYYSIPKNSQRSFQTSKWSVYQSEQYYVFSSGSQSEGHLTKSRIT